MAQHLVLWVIVPPLLWAAHPAHPVRTVRRAGVWPPRAHVGPGSVLHRQGWRVALAWIMVLATMYGTHLTPLYETSLQHQWLHEFEHAAYLFSSVLLWSTVLGSGRTMAPARAGLTVATAVPLIVLGMVLSSACTPMYPTYVEGLGASGALADQRSGAALMWLGSVLASLVLVVWSVLRWAHHGHQMQLMVERSEDARVAPRR